MGKPQVKIHKWLYPASWLYGMGVGLRNKLFDWKIIRSKSFDIPIICIGNLSVGGTGKTPHTEYLIRLLQNDCKIAVLSRGYKRSTSGFVLSDRESSVVEIGDEPFQIKKKFPEITVAVDEKRSRGIEQLMNLSDQPANIILLDDAYQHRYVSAGMNILLTDYNRLFCKDALLPAGRLREPVKGKDRAQIIIVTKCPDTLTNEECENIAGCLKLKSTQQLYFSGFRYGTLKPVFEEFHSGKTPFDRITASDSILMVTGIASPAPLFEELSRYTPNIEQINFVDHHNFTDDDILNIEKRFVKLGGSHKIIVTTEKDAARFLTHSAVSDELKRNMYMLPIEVEILQRKQHIFNQNIINYVRKNKRNSRLPER